MSYPLELIEWVPCAPMFVPDGDGFALSPDAVEMLALMDPPQLSVADRIAALRTEARALAAVLPAASRSMVGGELLAVAGALQEATNALAAGSQAVVGELDRQGSWESMGATSTAKLLANELRLRPAEATRRVNVARSTCERVGLDAQVLAPLREQVAAAQASGAISPDHAAVICSALNRLPVGLSVDQVELVEAALVELAGKTDPTTVALAGRRAVDRFDPDGPEPRDEQQRRRRGIRMSQRDDGAGALTGELTADLLVKLQTVLSPLAQPRPDDAHGPDTRTPAQRMHDALEDVCDRLLRSGTLPDSGGVPATITVTMTLSELQHAVSQGADGVAATGRVESSFGDLSIAQLLNLASEAEIVPVVLDDAGGILAYGQTKRFATAAQTKALRARDQGCTFPAATDHPNGANATMSSPGCSADPPTSTTSPCSAPTTTTTSRSGAGKWSWNTANPAGSHRNTCANRRRQPPRSTGRCRTRAPRDQSSP